MLLAIPVDALPAAIDLGLDDELREIAVYYFVDQMNHEEIAQLLGVSRRTVGNRVETGFHLLQLWTRYQERAEEVLVLYPADGYWRARPLPPQNLRWSAYGSSFLIGPVETSGRPFVDIKDVAFDPATRTFTLNFVHGGSATLRLDKLDQ